MVLTCGIKNIGEWEYEKFEMSRKRRKREMGDEEPHTVKKGS